MKLAVLFAVTFFVAPVTHAAFASGERLAQGCGHRDMAGEFFCMAYISGVLDSNPQCGPYPFSLREAMGMVASWLSADPARQKLSGPEVVMSSIRERFPCKSR
jgi:Ssp1 endopeptidase immunity protein Rap1a